MKKLSSIFLAAFFGLALFAGAMPAPASAQMSMGIRVGPMPPPRAEVVPVAPGPYYHWDAGHWRWYAGRWVWVPGHYVRGRRGAHWVPGYYGTRPNGVRVWIGGRWQ